MLVRLLAVCNSVGFYGLPKHAGIVAGTRDVLLDPRNGPRCVQPRVVLVANHLRRDSACRGRQVSQSEDGQVDGYVVFIPTRRVGRGQSISFHALARTVYRLAVWPWERLIERSTAIRRSDVFTPTAVVIVKPRSPPSQVVAPVQRAIRSSDRADQLDVPGALQKGLGAAGCRPSGRLCGVRSMSNRTPAR